MPLRADSAARKWFSIKQNHGRLGGSAVKCQSFEFGSSRDLTFVSGSSLTTWSLLGILSLPLSRPFYLSKIHCKKDKAKHCSDAKSMTGSSTVLRGLVTGGGGVGPGHPGKPTPSQEVKGSGSQLGQGQGKGRFGVLMGRRVGSLWNREEASGVSGTVEGNTAGKVSGRGMLGGGGGFIPRAWESGSELETCFKRPPGLRHGGGRGRGRSSSAGGGRQHGQGRGPLAKRTSSRLEPKGLGSARGRKAEGRPRSPPQAPGQTPAAGQKHRGPLSAEG